VGRKLVVGNVIIGVAGVIGGDRGREQAQRVFGSSKHRISNAEKQFARSQRDKNGQLNIISKDPKTGETVLLPPTPPTRTNYAPGSVPDVLSTAGNIYSNSPDANSPSQRESYLDRNGKLTY